METKSFKENVLDSILVGAKSYQSLLGLDFIMSSDSFLFQKKTWTLTIKNIKVCHFMNPLLIRSCQGLFMKTRI